MKRDRKGLHTCPEGTIKSNKKGKIWSMQEALLRIIAAREFALATPSHSCSGLLQNIKLTPWAGEEKNSISHIFIHQAINWTQPHWSRSRLDVFSMKNMDEMLSLLRDEEWGRQWWARRVDYMLHIYTTRCHYLDSLNKWDGRKRDAFALPYICNTGMAMLFNAMVDTGQDTASDCSARPLILLGIHLEHKVSHIAYTTGSTDRKKTRVRLLVQTWRVASAHLQVE